MASRNEQQVVFAVSMKLPAGLALDEARDWLVQQLVASITATPQVDPRSQIPTQSVRAKLLQRTVIYR